MQSSDASIASISTTNVDAAATGVQENRDAGAAIAAAVPVPVQTGGGVRNRDAALALFDAGVERVVIGTAALADPDFVRDLAADHRVAVGLDANAGEVATDGWLVGSGRSVLDVARSFVDAGVDAFVVTDISRDGTLEGPDLVGLREVVEATPVDVIASGGIGTIADLRALAEIDVGGRRLAGVITGKAMYEGRFTVAEGVAALEIESCAFVPSG